MAHTEEMMINGVVTNVRVFDETAQEIDDAAAKSKWQVNPNLLDNWYFANPINQRGQTSYSGNGYTIDRWTSNGGMNVVLTDSGLLLTANEALEYGYLAEYLETLPPLGTTVTLSALVDGQLHSAGGKLTGSTYVTITLSDSNSIVFDEANKRVYPMVYPNHPYTISAIKLELGDHQTLAHQDENGVWQLNEIPDYGEQLRRCQRYFVNFNPYKMEWFAMPPAVASNAQQAYSAVTLPVAMREQPVVSYGGNIVLSQSTDHTITQILVSDGTFTGNCVQLRYEVGADILTANTLYRVQGNNDPTSYIWLSADL